MDELYAIKTPYSAEAEQAVLGSMLIDRRCIADVIELIKPEDFYIQQNREVFETIYMMFQTSQPIDAVTVLARMRERGVYDEKTSRAYVLELMDITPTSANVREYAAIVKDNAILREIGEAAGDIAGMVSSGGDAQTVLDAAEQKIYGIREGRSSQQITHIGTVLIDLYSRLEELAKNGGNIPGIPTGIPEIDAFISGLNKSDLILIASRPGMGKTSFAGNIGLHAAKTSGKAVVFFSLEMSTEQLASRLLSSEAMVDSKKLMTGRLDDEDWKRIAHGARSLNGTRFYIDDNPAINVNEMKAKCRRVDDLGLIIIDYLQLMQGTRNTDNRVQEVGEISRSLKIMAKELNVPVVCLSQLSRANESRADKRPMLSDLRESGAIEQDADIVMFLYRDDYYNEDSEMRGVAECIVAKNRHGETGKVELQWIPQYTMFSPREWRHHDPKGN